MGCCDDNVELSTPGQNGNNGLTYYPHIAYADNVVAGTPDVITNFSNTPLSTSYWAAIIFTLSDTVPLQAAYENAWFEYRGADGAAITGIDVEENNVGITTNSTILNFFGSGASGVTVTDAGSGQADIEIITAALIKTTRTNILIDISANALIPGVTYWITDVGDGADDPSQESGIILRAIADNKLGIDGIYVAKVVDRSVVTTLYDSHTNYVYDGITDFYVEAFNEVYRLDTVAAAADYPTHPSDDGANWTFITKDTALLYKLELHSCKYDVENNIIRSREDSRGNKLTNIGLVGATGNEFIQQCFRWGVDTTINNNIVCYQDVGGWSSGRYPDFSSWYQDYSSVGLFYGNTIDAGVVFKNTDFEAITEVYGCTFKCPMVSALTNIDFNTNTGGFSPTITLINSKFTDTVISNCHTSTFTNSEFVRCNLDDITGSTFTEDNFTDCNFDAIYTCTFSNNIMLDSKFGYDDRIPGIVPIENSTITHNTGNCGFANLNLCQILYNDFTKKAGQPSGNQYSVIKNAYDFKYSANTSFEFLEIGDTDHGVFSALPGANAVFNGYSVCSFDFIQNTIDSHLEIALIRPDLVSRPGNTREDNSFYGNTFNGGYHTRLINIIFSQATTFGFGYCTFGNDSGIINFIIEPDASYRGTAGTALDSDFNIATTGWSNWDINIIIDGNSITTTPYNYVSSGTARGANYDIEECTSANDPSNKLITETESNAIGFLDMDDSTIFAGGVLAIPIGMQWIGKYYLYNANITDIITNITGLADFENTKQIIKEFRILPNGAGTNTLIFRPTAKASATASTFSHTSTSDLTLTSLVDVIKIKRSSLASDPAFSSLEIVQTSIKA
jgi:hypothetical protein